MDWGPQQLEALRLIRAWLNNKAGPQVFYLAGFAGVGKTVIAGEVASWMGNVKFAAYTGKAASVMQQKGCVGAQTIHRLIYAFDEHATSRSIDGQPKFNLSTRSELIGADLLILDEVSMVDFSMARDLLSFRVKTLVLGDPAQLPPVGDDAGFFTSKAPDFQLTEIHRQAENDPIIKLSRIAREGGLLKFGTYGKSMVIRNSEVTMAMAKGVDQILCGKNATRRQKNAKMRTSLGRSGLFAAGDKIVCTRNNYDLGLLNGSIWQVEDVEFQDEKETVMTIRGMDPGSEREVLSVTATNAVLLGTEKELSDKDARTLAFFDFGYCITCHKAQGSQWGSLLVFFEAAAFKDDAAKWAYTAITRAAERIIIAI